MQMKRMPKATKSKTATKQNKRAPPPSRSKPAKGKIANNAIKRMARQCGTKRLSGCVYEAVRTQIDIAVEALMWTASILTEHAHRRTVSEQDLNLALEINEQRKLY